MNSHLHVLNTEYLGIVIGNDVNVSALIYRGLTDVSALVKFLCSLSRYVIGELVHEHGERGQGDHKHHSKRLRCADNIKSVNKERCKSAHQGSAKAYSKHHKHVRGILTIHLSALEESGHENGAEHSCSLGVIFIYSAVESEIFSRKLSCKALIKHVLAYILRNILERDEIGVRSYIRSEDSKEALQAVERNERHIIKLAVQRYYQAISNDHGEHNRNEHFRRTVFLKELPNRLNRLRNSEQEHANGKLHIYESLSIWNVTKTN